MFNTLWDSLIYCVKWWRDNKDSPVALRKCIFVVAGVSVISFLIGEGLPGEDYARLVSNLFGKLHSVDTEAALLYNVLGRKTASVFHSPAFATFPNQVYAKMRDLNLKTLLQLFILFKDRG